MDAFSSAMASIQVSFIFLEVKLFEANGLKHKQCHAITLIFTDVHNDAVPGDEMALVNFANQHSILFLYSNAEHEPF